jgi:hypothetical protein
MKRFLCALTLAWASVSSTGCGGDEESSNAPAATSVEGNLDGASMTARSALAQLSDDALATDRGYVSISISDWDQTCAYEERAEGAQVNFTLYVMGGTRADVRPGVYSVAGESRNGFSHEVVGGAGRYDAQGTTGDGFARYTSGTVTLDEVGQTVTGSFDLTTEDGDTLTGTFDATLCE